MLKILGRKAYAASGTRTHHVWLRAHLSSSCAQGDGAMLKQRQGLLKQVFKGPTCAKLLPRSVSYTAGEVPRDGVVTRYAALVQDGVLRPDERQVCCVACARACACLCLCMCVLHTY